MATRQRSLSSTGDGGFKVFSREAGFGCFKVVFADLEGKPLPVEGFGGESGGVAPGERVENDVSFVGEKLDEEGWDRFGEACWVNDGA